MRLPDRSPHALICELDVFLSASIVDNRKQFIVGIISPERISGQARENPMHETAERAPIQIQIQTRLIRQSKNFAGRKDKWTSAILFDR